MTRAASVVEAQIELRLRTEREINMSNFKKALFLIAVSGTASADTDPKPTIDFEFT